MKYVYLIFLGIIAINKIKCHVTDRAKFVRQSDTFTTQLPAENDTRNILGKEASEKKYESPKIVRDGESSVYLDDVLFAMKNQNWTAEEEPCLNHINRLLYSLQNFTLWAVWEWDSQASEPQGLLFGNRYQLGNFDQCMSAPWAKKQPELKTKYCLAEIVLERTDKNVRRKVEKPYYPYQSALDFIEVLGPHLTLKRLVMDYATKIDIGKLTGKENWSTWKYKISILLDGTEKALDVVEGRFLKPILAVGAGDADIAKYNTMMANYKKAETGALLMLTTNMSEDTLKKVMRFKTAHEVWLELHRLFDGQSEERAYNLGLEFFELKHDKADDIPTHMSKLKNVWNELRWKLPRLTTQLSFLKCF